MAVEQDQSSWVPGPPPPRPPARDAAIEAGLRKFDGVEEHETVRSRAPRAIGQRPKLAIAISALLLFLVFVPATMIGLRHEVSAPKSTRPAVALQDSFAQPRQSIAKTAPFAPAAGGPPVEEKVQAPGSSALAPRGLAEASKVVPKSKPAGETARLEAPTASSPGPAPEAMAAASPPPAPPPPPPAPSAALADARNAQPIAQDVVVTGALLRAPQAQGGAAAKVSEAAPMPEAYRTLLLHLQAALRADDRSAVIALINFPLRVGGAGGPRIYRDGQSVEREFDRIFTPRVIRAIAGQKPGKLTVRNRRAVVGKGEVWLAETCPDIACSAPGPVRIEVVNP
jgi:hypothetical protein